MGLRNARVGLAASCIKGPGHAAAEVRVLVTLDVAEGGEVRYAKVTAPELPEGSRACMQEALMRLRFRPGGTGGARERTMLVNLKDELPPSLTW